LTSGENEANAGEGVRQHVAVVGAGAFGGWTAWHLLRAGCQVTLLDAWGPGNSRSSSGGDTRVLRHGYGQDRIYQDLARRSLALFEQHERRWGTPLFERTGALWMAQDDDNLERATLVELEDAGIPHEVLQADELARRYPQMCFEGVRWALLESQAGVLSARRGCAAVRDAFVAAGGSYRVELVTPGVFDGGSMDGLRLAAGGILHADDYVFACGPWLGPLFPELGGEALVRATRQEVFTFGTPAGDTRHRAPRLPVWADHGERFWYGIPGNEERGFKLADDTRGETMDPTSDERLPSAEGLQRARDYLGFRFPALADAPLLEARVCQYEMSADGDFIADRHPAAPHVWLMGGGSGHGFKHGPALGELMAGCVLGARETEARFALVSA
jgi:glycine/D-amino acid oxidase-like deaminating enzyme